MQDNNSVTLKIAIGSFLLLFPGFFFYHSALGLQLIPPVLGGYFSPVALLLSPVLIATYLVKVRKSKALLTNIDLGFFAFVFYFFLVVAINAIFFHANADVVKMHLVAIFHLVVVFMIFKFSEFSLKFVFWGALICWIGMTMIIFFMSNDGFFYLRQQEATTNQDVVATYQGFGRSYFLTFLVLAPFIKRMPARIPVYLVSIAALYVNGARSEFVGALVAVVAVEVLMTKRRAVALGLLATFAIVGYLYATEFINMLPENRTLQLLEVDECSSCNDRRATVAYAIEVIKNSPLVGDFGNYIVDIENETPGSYAHNIVSAWVDLGFLGFVWLLLLFLVPLSTLISDANSVRGKSNLSELLLPLTLLLVTLVLLFTAKQFTYMLTGAALGSYANYCMKKRKRRTDSLLFPKPHARLQKTTYQIVG